MNTKEWKIGDKCPTCNKPLIGSLVCMDDNCGTIISTKDGNKILGLLSRTQIDLVSSFLVGHWGEIAASEHKIAFERILETLNPGALKAVKRLRGE